MRFEGEHIWVIGASSGIGEALAHELHAQGATLVLSARREEALQHLNNTLGGQHIVAPLDVSDTEQCAHVVHALRDNLGHVDRVIYLAALYEPGNILEADISFSSKCFDVNVVGALRIIQQMLPWFHETGKGQIVLCGSVAGFVGLPKGQPYSATKAAMINLAESLYAEHGHEVDIKLINPGFVRTPMTDKNSFTMPMRIEPGDAAKAIVRGLTRRGFEIHFPKLFTCMLKLLRLLPYRLALPLAQKAQ